MKSDWIQNFSSLSILECLIVVPVCIPGEDNLIVFLKKSLVFCDAQKWGLFWETMSSATKIVTYSTVLIMLQKVHLI